MVIGATGDELPGEGINTNRGAAYVFRKIDGKWFEHQKLIPRITFDDQQFGDSVAINGDSIAIGARSATEFAYVFRLQGEAWIEEARLEPIGGTLGGFGESVNISDDVLVVGAPLDSDIAFWSGAVHVFEFTNGVWEPRIKLLASDGHANARFGTSVDLNQETGQLFVGAPRQDVMPGSSGAVYVFQRSLRDSAFKQSAKVKPQDAPTITFGTSVACDGHRLLVGAPDDDMFAPVNSNGAAFIFELKNDNWIQTRRLYPNDPGSNDEFGFSVAIDGETIIVGAHQDGGIPDEPNEVEDHGSAYLFHLLDGEWTQATKLAGSTVFDIPFANFGRSVAISGDDAIAGAYRGAVKGVTQPGRVFVYDARPPVAADLTADQLVNGADLAQLLAQWGECTTPPSIPCNPNPCSADLNMDGVINGLDLASLLSAWTGQ